jgi:hypothetical protein
MKTAIKKDKIITDADFEGPMMIYNPMTQKQEKELGEWVAKQKAKLKNKQLKSKV